MIENKEKKHVEVVAAIISDSNNNIFCAQRGYGFLEGKWEFPGGKVEKGETNEEALIREIKEELNSEITVNKFFATVTHEYDSFIITMHCYLCNLREGKLEINKSIHLSSCWLNKNSLLSVEWAPADFPIVEKIIRS